MAGMGPQGGMEVTDASMAPEVTLPRSPYRLVMAWQDEGWGMALILIGGHPLGPHSAAGMTCLSAGLRGLAGR